MQKKIFIVPCNGAMANGHITWLAAQELVLEGKAIVCRSWNHINEILENNEHASSFIIVDGCENQCLFNQLIEEGLVGKHYLMLSDIGIDAIHHDDITRQDVELAKDAIVAECKPVTKTPPIYIPGCTCR